MDFFDTGFRSRYLVFIAVAYDTSVVIKLCDKRYVMNQVESLGWSKSILSKRNPNLKTSFPPHTIDCHTSNNTSIMSLKDLNFHYLLASFITNVEVIDRATIYPAWPSCKSARPLRLKPL